MHSWMIFKNFTLFFFLPLGIVYSHFRSKLRDSDRGMSCTSDAEFRVECSYRNHDGEPARHLHFEERSCPRLAPDWTIAAVQVLVCFRELDPVGKSWCTSHSCLRSLGGNEIDANRCIKMSSNETTIERTTPGSVGERGEKGRSVRKTKATDVRVNETMTRQ